MTTLEINLSESLREFVEAQVISGNYENASAFIETILGEMQAKERQRNDTRERLADLLQEGVDSGTEIEVTAEFWEERKAVLLARRAKRQRASQEQPA